MSVRAVPTPLPNRTSGRTVGLVAALAVALVGVAQGQTPQPPASPSAADALDARPPLPPEEPKRPPAAAEYRMNPDRRIYTEIQDGFPVQSEQQNPDEYQAWTEVVNFARTRTVAGLERYAARDLTPEDLVRSPSTRSSPTGGSVFRLALVRFDGKLTKVRRVEPTKALAELGLKDLYEGWLVPVDEPPSEPVCVVFTDPPAGLDLGEQHDRWVTFAGYFFKVMAYPGPNADVKKEPNPKSPAAAGWLLAPLLVGRSVTLLPGPPPEATSVALDKNLRVFQRIKDDAPMQARKDNWEEGAAWDRVVLHARKFAPEALEKAVRRDVGFADLFEKNRLDYKLELVHVEGRLVRLRKLEKPSPRLTEAGVTVCYEAWIIPKDEPSGHPVCVVVTELPEGLEPQPAAPGQKLLNKWVTFAGYSFKLLRYRSNEMRKDDPSENQWKAAPLLIGRAVTLRDDPAGDPGYGWRTVFVPAIVGGLLVIVGVAVGLSWWFRRGDRRARAEVEAVRDRNPFGDGAA